MPLGFSKNAVLGCRTRHVAGLLSETQPLLSALDHGASREALRDVLAQARAAKAPWLARFASESEHGFELRRENLFPAEDLDPVDEWTFSESERGEALSIDGFDAADAEGPGTLVRRCAAAVDDAASLRRVLDEPARELLDAFLDAGVVVDRPPPTRVERRAGITRLQHAALLIRSETTTLLVDPHFHSGFTSGGALSTDPASLVDEVDAVLISHSHEDHWDLPSLLMFRRDTLFIVPRVPRASILADAMGPRLRSLGFTRVVELDWYGVETVGDIEVRALPFFGEQPTVAEPAREAAVRNWGSTYFVRTPQTRIWFLIDSGDDYEGSMLDVAAHVREALGGVDVILSNLRSFNVGVGRGSPSYVALGAYWLSLSADQIQRFTTMSNDRITLGTVDVARVCAAAGAPLFLPYAHWWAPIGSPGQREAELVLALARDLDAARAATRIQPWTIGATLSLRGAEVRA